MGTSTGKQDGRSLLARVRGRVPDHLIGELLSKEWIDTAIPAVALGVILASFAWLTPGFYSPGNLSDLLRLLGEYAFIAIGAAIIVIAGGIDLSVGSVFALCNFLALALVFKLNIHVLVALVLTVIAGACLGAINGVLIGFLRLRAFLTTLVTLVIFRAIFDLITTNYASTLLRGGRVNGVGIWDFLADGDILGLPSSFVFAGIVGVLAHLFLTRGSLGWQILAVGGSRRAAFNNGIPVRRTIFRTYAIGGALTGLAAFFFAARLNTAGSSTGTGLELLVITGVVLGGISLGGGRGSIAKALLGIASIVCLTSGMLRLGLAGGASSMVMGAVLVLAVVFDIRWTKNRHKLLARTYVSPTYFRMPELQDTTEGAIGPYGINDALADVKAIGLGKIEGPEDVILDANDNLYCGSRHGDIVRFFAPDYDRMEVFAHIGGHPLGMAFDRDGSLVACVAGMGLFRITPEGKVIQLTSQTGRTTFSLIDDSRIKMADDLDIAPDGRIFFTDPSIRYELSDWLSEALEMRRNGRLLCFNPATGKTETIARKLIFPNGVCSMLDGQSILVASTWSCSIQRYWYAGPKAGTIETFIDDLPGYPDNINRASDGTYWCALVGMRSPAFDLMLEMPNVRKRMIARIAPDNWLFANTNAGCLIRFDADGNVIESLWDRSGKAHSHITSMREHKGRLFIGGLRNNRIGMIELAGRDAEWSGPASYWGGQ